jgi:hypothetical protein
MKNGTGFCNGFVFDPVANKRMVKMKHDLEKFFDIQTTGSLLGTTGYFAAITVDLMLSRVIGLLTIFLLLSKLYDIWFRKAKKSESDE